MIEYDVDINAKNKYGSTPFHWTSHGRHLKEGSILRLLLKHGDDVNARKLSGSTPLHLVSRSDRLTSESRLEVVRLLLEYGADVEAKGNRDRTALQVASERGYDEVVKFLQENGAK